MSRSKSNEKFAWVLIWSWVSHWKQILFSMLENEVFIAESHSKDRFPTCSIVKINVSAICNLICDAVEYWVFIWKSSIWNSAYSIFASTQLSKIPNSDRNSVSKQPNDNSSFWLTSYRYFKIAFPSNYINCVILILRISLWDQNYGWHNDNNDQ